MTKDLAWLHTVVVSRVHHMLRCTIVYDVWEAGSHLTWWNGVVDCAMRSSAARFDEICERNVRLTATIVGRVWRKQGRF